MFCQTPFVFFTDPDCVPISNGSFQFQAIIIIIANHLLQSVSTVTISHRT